MVTGGSGIRVEGIWGEDRRWIIQAHIWWPDTKWIEREKDPLCCNVEWILTKEGKLPKIENEFWKRAEGKMVFIAGKISMLVPVGWRYQRMWVLHRRSGGSTNRAHNVMLLTKKEIYIFGFWIWRQRHHAQSRGVWIRG